ncbi:hypothetical protein [Bradyrhizobium sp. USDA 313]|uniref:hypothetical protein n=1 Tax=Bradyrhizobium sp. USDA 313 TaxID=3156307 RepID=UPI003512ABAD
MQAADIDARSVPELCVKTLRDARIATDSAGGCRGSDALKTKTRKQPHAQYKSLKISLVRGERTDLTRRG